MPLVDDIEREEDRNEKQEGDGCPLMWYARCQSSKVMTDCWGRGETQAHIISWGLGITASVGSSGLVGGPLCMPLEGLSWQGHS